MMKRMFTKSKRNKFRVCLIVYLYLCILWVYGLSYRYYTSLYSTFCFILDLSPPLDMFLQLRSAFQHCSH